MPEPVGKYFVQGTVLPPEGAAQVPSPRRNTVLSAVPEPSRAVATVPLLRLDALVVLRFCHVVPSQYWNCEVPVLQFIEPAAPDGLVQFAHADGLTKSKTATRRTSLLI